VPLLGAGFYLTGGEPFLRADLFDLVAGATMRSKAILFTNGTLLSPAHAGRLAAHRERLVVQISLEGPHEASNALLRGKGSFAAAMEGIRHLLRAGVRVGQAPHSRAGLPAPGAHAPPGRHR
jgi:MoaA/NifB/PqqE/SkfB family radical SAM enzyme